MQVSQIFLCDGKISDNLNDYLKDNIELTKKYYSNYDYVLYDWDKIIKFIQDNFEDEVLWAFHYLNPYTYKVDLARYCLMYKLGGFYFDVGLKPYSPINPGNYDLIVFRDIPKYANINNNVAVAPGALYAKPGNIIFKNCIDKIIQNCKNHYYGYNALEPTGPILFGQKIAELGVNPNIYMGLVTELTPDRYIPNGALILNDGTIVAFGKPKWSKMSGVANGTNNYSDMYDSKVVYGTEYDRINFLYKKYLKRQVDQDAISCYSGMHIDTIEQIILNSEEYGWIKKL